MKTIYNALNALGFNKVANKIADIFGLQAALDAKATTAYVDATFIPLTQRAANNGVATLDSGGKIPAAQLPNTVMEFQGTWNATTNTPTLADGTGNAGDVYLVSVGGTINLGSGAITFVAGDFVIYSGSVWQKSDNSIYVASNAITKSGNTFKLGGPLTEDTSITGTNSFGIQITNATKIFDFNINGNYVRMTVTKGANYNLITVETNPEPETRIQSVTASKGFDLKLSDGDGLITLTGLSTLKFAADYSANYTDRSIIDKGYLVAQLLNYFAKASVLLAVDGSATAPAYAFANAPGSGFFHSNTHDVFLAINQITTFSFTTSTNESILRFLIKQGAVSNLGLAFSGDEDTGLYLIGANNLGIAANGTKIVDISTTRVETTVLRKYASDLSGSYDDRSLIDKAEADKRIIRPLADLTALKAFVTTDLPDKALVFVETLGLYRFDKTSTLTADNNLIIEPTTGGGRWLLATNTGNRYQLGGFAQLLNLVPKAVNTGNLASGDTDMYTCPSGKRAFVSRIAKGYNTAGSTTTYYFKLYSGGSYYRISADTNVNTVSGTGSSAVIGGTAGDGIVLEAGEKIAINTSQSGLNMSLVVYEFDNTNALKSYKNLSLTSGDNTIYTVPSGYVANLCNPPLNVGMCMISNSTVGSVTYLISANAVVLGKSTLATNTCNGGTFGTILEAGQTVVVNSDSAASGQIAWINVWEIPVSL